LFALTGARKSEFVKLRWDKVDVGTGCLRLRDRRTGANIIPLGQAALNLIADQPKIDEPIWVSRRCKSRVKHHLPVLKKIWGKACEKWEMPTIQIRNLRHYFALIGVANGTSLPVVGPILGHRAVSTTQRHAHLADNPVRNATDGIAAQIDNALSGGSVMEKDTSHFGKDHSLNDGTE
jgi:integrase